MWEQAPLSALTWRVPEIGFGEGFVHIAFDRAGEVAGWEVFLNSGYKRYVIEPDNFGITLAQRWFISGDPGTLEIVDQPPPVVTPLPPAWASLILALAAAHIGLKRSFFSKRRRSGRDMPSVLRS